MDEFKKNRRKETIVIYIYSLRQTTWAQGYYSKRKKQKKQMT